MGAVAKAKGQRRSGAWCRKTLRYVELLLHAPWTVTLSAASGFPFDQDKTVLVAIL